MHITIMTFITNVMIEDAKENACVLALQGAENKGKGELNMKQFQFTVQDQLGIHARPAGLLAKLAKEYKDTVITITKDGSTVKASQLMKLMGLAVKQGSEVTVAAEGPAEDEAISAMQKFFEENL